jgi:2-methylisocitrate lyase-like PEP mutase family enzyme
MDPGASADLFLQINGALEGKMRTGKRVNGDLAVKADALRRLHSSPRPLVLPNAWDVASARRIEGAGFPVVATSSGAVAASLGYEDNNSMPADEAFSVVARISRNVSIPVTADMEAGYHLPAEDFVNRLVGAGAVGCNLEDRDHDSGSGLIDADQQADWLHAVRRAAADIGIDIVLNARVDSLGQEGDREELFEEAVRRARVYLHAGADCAFPIRLVEEDLIRDFVARVDGPVNIVGPGAPPVARLAELGVARVSFAGYLMRSVYRDLEQTLSSIAIEFSSIS